MPVERKPFSKILKDLRKEKKVTQEQLAHALGVSPQAVSKWENSSYPEGDLLPAIADFFGVSIDYLYGRSDRDKSIEEKVFDAVSECAVKEFEEKGKAAEHYKTAQLIRNIEWAMQTSLWVNNKNYYEKVIGKKEEPKMASVVTDDVLYSYIGLREDSDFHFSLTRSKDYDIYEELLKDTGKQTALFKFLSNKENISIVSYLYTLKNDEFVGAEVIAKALKISNEKVKSTLDELFSLFDEEHTSMAPILCATVVNADNKEEKIYGARGTFGGLFMAIMMLAKEFIDMPQAFHMQINAKEKSWLDREKLFKK